MKTLFILLALCATAHAGAIHQNGASPSTIIADIAGQAIAPASIATTGNGSIGGSVFTVGVSTLNCSGGSCAIAGVKDGSLAAAGYIGEISSGTMVSVVPVSDTYIAVATITLTAGEWNISGTGSFATGGTTAMTRAILAISNSNTTNDSFGVGSSVVWDQAYPVSGNFDFNLGPRFVSINTTTSYYIVCRLTFTVAGGVTCGSSNRGIWARRVR